MAVDDWYVPDGVYLKCDQGATIVNLKVNFKKHKLYGEIIATEADHIPIKNIPSFGACSSTGNACTPTDTYWVNKHEGGTLVQKQKPLLDKSFCKCMKGGNIKIFFSEADAIAALEADKEERVDKIPYVDAILGGATLGPLNPLYLFTDTEPSDVGRGIRKGAKSTYQGLKQMVLHPIDTAKGLGKLAMTGVVGYSVPLSPASLAVSAITGVGVLESPEKRIAEFDKMMGTDLTSIDKGIKASASEFYDEKIVHGTNAERGVLIGQAAEFIGELVVGSKGAGAAIKSAKGSAVVVNASEKLSKAITTINEFVKATKLGKLAKSIKGIFKVGRKIYPINIEKFINETLEEANKLVKTLSAKERGPCLSAIYDPATGKTFFRKNFKNTPAGDLEYEKWLTASSKEGGADEITKKIINDYKTKYKSGEINHNGKIVDRREAAHSEIRALDDAIKERRIQGIPVDENSVKEMYLHNRDLQNKAILNNDGIPPVKDRCPHCEILTDKINVINHN